MNIGANGLLIVLLSRFFLEPDGYGLLFFTLSILAIAQLAANLGVGRSTARYISEYKEIDQSQVPHILTISFQIKVVLIVLICVFLVISRNTIADVLNQTELSALLLIGCIFIAFQSMKSYAVSLFQGFNAVEYSAAISIVDNISRIGFVVLFVVMGFGVTGVLVGYTVSGIIAGVLGMGILYFQYYRRYDAAICPEAGLRKQIIKYSVPLTASESANVIDKRVDILLIGFFLNPVAVGFYTLAKQISEFVVAPAGSVGFALSPTYGEDKANNQLNRAARIYEASLKHVLLLYVPAAVGLFIVAEEAVPLVFGPEYTAAVPVVQILSVYILFQAVTSISTQALDYLGRAQYRALAKGATSVANAILNILLIPTFGIEGAAAATVFTFGIYTLTNVYIMHIELPLQYDSLLRTGVGVTIISMIMGGIVIVASKFITGPFSLVIVVSLGICVWGALASVSGLLDVRKTMSLVA